MKRARSKLTQQGRKLKRMVGRGRIFLVPGEPDSLSKKDFGSVLDFV